MHLAKAGNIPTYNEEELSTDEDLFDSTRTQAEADAESEGFAVAENSNFDEEYNSYDENTEEGPYAFKTINFKFNSNKTLEGQGNSVEQDIEVARTAIQEGKSIVINGHACQLGTPAHNLALSLNRAQVIKNTMIAHGLPAEKIEIIGMGNEMPLVWTEEKERGKQIAALAPNRRVEISIN